MTNQTINIPVGKIIAQRRREKGLTQEVVAELLDVTIEAISRMERGTIMPSLKRLEQFADIYECQLTDLLTQSSRRLDDQAAHINDLLTGISENDRALVVNLVEKLTERLRQ